MSVRGAIIGTVGAVAGFFVGGPAGAAALGAAGYQAGASMDGADKEVEAAKKNQEAANAQVDELTRRAQENTAAIMRDAEVFKGDQMSATVRGGVDVSSTSSLVAMENSHAKFKREAFNQERDARLEGARIRQEAQNDVDAAKRAREATQISSITNVLQAGATAYGASTKSGAAAGGAPKGGYSDSFKQTGVRSHRYATPYMD
jgi:hypothetical protein